MIVHADAGPSIIYFRGGRGRGQMHARGPFAASNIG